MKNLGFCLLLLAACGSSSKISGDDDTSPDASETIGDSSTTNTDAASPDAMVCAANTQVDPNNCGACGRSCLGNTCSVGKCEPDRMDSGDITRIGDFTTDNLFIYYTGIAASGSSPHRLWKLVIGAGTAADYLGLFAHPDPIGQIAFDGDYFYAADPARINGGNSGVVKKLNKEPGGGTNLLQNLEPTTTASWTQNGYVYWATDSDGSNGGDIKRVLATGGAISTISASTGRVVYLGADSTNFFWVDNSSALRRAPVAGGPPVTITSGKADFIDMDATRIYMVRKDTGEAISVSKAGGSASILGTGMTAGGAIDDEHLYAAQDNKLVAVTKAGVAVGTLWEKAPEGTANCPTTFAVTRTKVIGDYVYFLAVPTTCNDVEIYNQIYRIARM